MRSKKVVKPGWNLEYVMWIFTRLSAVSITLLAAITMAAAFIMGARTKMHLGALMRWTFFPNVNHVINTEIPNVTEVWANGFWQIMQILIVFFGVTHGFNGLRVVVEDYVKSSFRQVVIRSVIFLAWIFMMLVSVYVVFSS